MPRPMPSRDPGSVKPAAAAGSGHVRGLLPKRGRAATRPPRPCPKRQRARAFNVDGPPLVAHQALWLYSQGCGYFGASVLSGAAFIFFFL